MQDQSLKELLNAVVAVVLDAGSLVMGVYKRDFLVENKADASPVTEADALAEALIVPRLSALLPEVQVVAEEAVAAGNLPVVGDVFWLVDPLDGTKEFISRNGEFTVNVALVKDGRPILGVVFAPAIDVLYAGAEGWGSWKRVAGSDSPISVRAVPSAGLTVVSSRSHGDADALDRFLAGRKVASTTNAGSSLKLCLVADGQADLYPRLGRTMEWDIAAGDAVLRASGGVVVTLDGQPMHYGKPCFENPHFAAWGQSPLRAGYFNHAD